MTERGGQIPAMGLESNIDNIQNDNFFIDSVAIFEARLLVL